MSSGAKTAKPRTPGDAMPRKFVLNKNTAHRYP
jgi:hypothetical protein